MSTQPTISMFILLIFSLAIQIQCLSIVDRREKLNERPIIGILSQEISRMLKNSYQEENEYHSYIAASYVKFIEGAGARVVPIWIGMDESYYETIMSKINGVLLPGGATWFNATNGYASAGKIIYRIAKNYNRNGDYFPIFGICLGFELLTYLEANEVEHRSRCNSFQSLPLEFTQGYHKSRMFKDTPWDVIGILRDEPVTANSHRFCVTMEDLKSVSLTDDFRVMSLNRDHDNIQFISSLEHVTLPFYGVQFHPEKNLYEWVTTKSIPHGYEATKATQWFANFFVEEARKNQHYFSGAAEEDEYLIYNYQKKFTGRVKSVYEESYLFTKSDRRFLQRNKLDFNPGTSIKFD